MPVKKTGGLNDFSALDQTNTAGFLFGNEDKTEDKSYLQMANEDNFPTLRNVAQNVSSWLLCLFVFTLTDEAFSGI